MKKVMKLQIVYQIKIIKTVINFYKKNHLSKSLRYTSVFKLNFPFDLIIFFHKISWFL